MIKISQIPTIFKIFYVIILAFSLFTIYDHIDKYLGRETINYCKKPKPTENLMMDKFQIITPNTRSFDSDEIEINTQNLKGQNFDQLIESIISKHFDDISSSKFEILNNYQVLSDQNTVQQLRSTVISFLAKSKYIREISTLYKQLKEAQLHLNCENVSTSEIHDRYKGLSSKIDKLSDIENQIQGSTKEELEKKNKTYNILTELKWQKSKEESNLRYYLHQLQSNQYKNKKTLTAEQQKFLKDYQALIRALESEIEAINKKIDILDLDIEEVKNWRFDMIIRNRQILRLKKQELPLTSQINTIKDTIQNLQNVKRENSQIISGFQKEREQLKYAVSRGYIDKKQADKQYENRVVRYFNSIKQLIQIKYYTFKKHKVSSTLQELEKQLQYLDKIELNLNYLQEIDKKHKELEKLKKYHKELTDLQDTDIENSRKIIRQKIKQCESNLNTINKDITEIQRENLNSAGQSETIKKLKTQADLIRKELSPQYHLYIQEVDRILKIVNDCKTAKIRLESLIKQFQFRTEELSRKSESLNSNLHYIQQILNEKIKE